MRLYLDTEFNGLHGELISMAVVSDDGREWYEVMSEPDVWNEWVFDHVRPLLQKAPIGAAGFLKSLYEFIRPFDGAEVIADWPADFEHLCNALTEMGARNGYILPVENLTMRLLNSPMLSPEIPHNALSDARALRDWHQSTLRGFNENVPLAV